jgi:hypothetical protein
MTHQISLLHYLKPSGAVVAQSGLLRSTKFPTHGVSSGATILPPLGSGAVVAQFPSRARSAPNPLPAIGQRSRLPATLGQSRKADRPPESLDMIGNSQPIAEQQDDRSPAQQMFGKGRRNSPHHRLMRVHKRNRQIINAAATVQLQRQGRRLVSTAVFRQSAPRPSPDHQRESASAFSRLPGIRDHRAAERIHGLPAGFAAGITFPCASRSLIRRDRTPHNPLWRNETHPCHHLSKDQKDIYARALSRPLTLLEAVEPAREARRRRNVEGGRNA